MFFEQYDKELKKAAFQVKVSIPDSLSEKMNEVYDGLSPEDDGLSTEPLPGQQYRVRTWHVPYLRYGLAVAGILCMLLVMVPASAELWGYWHRMAGMDNGEKGEYVSGIIQSAADGDVFSRKLTDAERKKMKKLIAAYEQGERFPAEKILVIHGKQEIQSGRVCFLEENSTFYLPGKDMTDEQILQIIDFNHKREYSVGEELAGEEEKEKEEKEEQGDMVKGDTAKRKKGKRLGRKELVALGMEWIQKVYGKDVSDWKISTEKMDSTKYGYTIYDITYIKVKTSAEYVISIDDLHGEMLKMNCVYNGKKENIVQGLSFGGRKQATKYYEEVKKLAEKITGHKEVKTGYCVYYLDKKNKKLSFGMISFWIEYCDGTSINVLFSQNSKEYYQINYYEGSQTKIMRKNTFNFVSSARKKCVIKFQ